ncbi:MAG: epoxyqueuosine reductase QueH [Coriobacteriales bacterium]|jgi:predicted adenine nucleotide alpha hydrolase (AANH) superfamily ATPase|nr:epoxyqueuosine reductase QueH [Coriobacteriales bacterium]
MRADSLSKTGTPDLLLHVCCAPCSIIPLSFLARDGLRVHAFYFNPNIQPQDEYQRRLETFVAWASSLGLPFSAPDYQGLLWEEDVAVFGGPYPLIANSPDYAANRAARLRRCSACYRLRFEAAARVAAERGIACIASTLTISPYQFVETINAELARAAATCGLSTREDDFRAFYSEAVALSRQAGLYRQNYCGCRFSAQEAELERVARRAARREQRSNTKRDTEGRESSESGHGDGSSVLFSEKLTAAAGVLQENRTDEPSPCPLSDEPSLYLHEQGSGDADR